jgi:hypothetical protein
LIEHHRMHTSYLFPDVDPGNPILEKPGIVRYMSLHAFMMLLTGQVFIPSIRKLQERDPLESLLPTLSIPDFGERCLKLHKGKSAEWLRNHAETRPSESQSQNVDDRLKIWLRELAVRRCIWCWFGDSEESMGLWNSFGARGVAVASSVGRIRKAFPLPQMEHTSGTSVGRVKYVERRADQFDGTDNDPDWFYRPYYFKHKCYSYEQEIRFVIDLYAANTLQHGGSIFHVDPNQLIGKVILSPQFWIAEARALDSILKEKFPWISISISPLLSVEEVPDIRPAGIVNPRFICKDPIENTLFGVV